MPPHFLLYTLCLFINTPVLLTDRVRLWNNKPHLELPSSYESLEIIPYISSKLADRTSMINQNVNEQDKLVTLFTNTKNEAAIRSADITTTLKRKETRQSRKILKRKVKDAEAFLSEMLRVLQNLFAKKPMQENKQMSKQNSGTNIAWSYYDDLGK